jgi:phosphoglycolate phosphatase-like HAD superfamily hydrolase
MKLVLWDVDGTLVDTAGHGWKAFGEAFETVFGRPPEGLVPMAGHTDHEIALRILASNGVEAADTHLPRMWSALADALTGRQERMAAEGRAQPGAREALQAVGDRADALQSLLTGNIEANAVLKLAAFDLERLVDFEIGGYGSDRRVRSELVGVACARASEKHGIGLTPEDAVLIGDTPLDIAAAHDAGARAVAVASGPHAIEELGDADAVLEDLRDTDALMAALELSPR